MNPRLPGIDANHKEYQRSAGFGKRHSRWKGHRPGTKVGSGSFVKQLAHSAKQKRRSASQLLIIINQLLKS